MPRMSKSGRERERLRRKHEATGPRDEKSRGRDRGGR